MCDAVPAGTWQLDATHSGADSPRGAPVSAHVLLAPSRAELYRHLVSGRPGRRERLLAGMRMLLDGLG